MIRKNLMKVVAVSLTSAMVIVITQGLKYDVTTGQAEFVIQNTEAFTKNDPTAPKKIDNKVTKKEDVFVISNYDGSVKDIIVSDWLMNGKQLDSIEDISELTDIENVKGDEKFNEKDGKGTWDSKGKDIFYQGKIKKELPVDISISYKLDGKEIKGEDLAGKSGKVEINFNYKNNVKKTMKVGDKEEEMYSPFIMVTGLVLDDSYTNIDISNNGKVIETGDKSIVVGYALPGMQENLGIDSGVLNLPTNFTIKADVKDFKLTTAMSIALNDEFSKIKDISSENDIEQSLNDLGNATDKLVNGADALYNGVKKLKESTKELPSGVSKLKDGSGKLSDGLSTAKNGTNELDQGVGKLKDGSSKLSDGLGELKDGSGKLNNGINASYEGSKKLSSGAKQISQGADKLNSAVQSAVGGMANIPDVSQLKTAANSIDAGVDSVATNLESTINSNKAILQGLKSSVAGVTDETAKQQINGCISNLEKTIAGQNALLANLKAGGALKNGTSQLKTQANNFPNAEKLNGLKSSIKQLTDGTSTLSTKLKELSKGADDLSSGLKEIKNGSNSLNTGIKSAYSGGVQLNNGLKSAKTGSNALNTGLSTLSTGAKTLDNGLLTLKNGTNALTGGIGKLSDGTKTLNDGMKQYKEQGIDKIMSFYKDNLGGLKDRLQAIKELADEYNTFSGKADNMAGTVKFIYRTESIGDKDDLKKED